MESIIIRMIVGLCSVTWGIMGIMRKTLLKDEESRIEVDVFFCTAGLIVLLIGIFELALL